MFLIHTNNYYISDRILTNYIFPEQEYNIVVDKHTKDDKENAILIHKNNSFSMVPLLFEARVR